MQALKRSIMALLLVAAAGCEAFTSPKPIIDTFTFEVVENESNVVEGVTIAALFGDISFLGQTKTPTLCYSASAKKLDVDGNTLTVDVAITSSGSGTCTQQAGGVRYSGTIMNLDRGTYVVKIRHTVAGSATQEFTQTIEL